jgi:GxxExxY protein
MTFGCRRRPRLSEQQEAAKTEFLNRRSQRSQRRVGVFKSGSVLAEKIRTESKCWTTIKTTDNNFVYILRELIAMKETTRVNQLSHQIIGGAIEVHRLKGAGLIETIYQRCMERELDLRELTAVRQMEVEIEYKGLVFREPLKLDLLVENCVLVELKSVERILPIHKAQLLSYMKLLEVPVGLLINFHEPVLKDGITRLILNTDETRE